ncbi:MAG: hypothetical protein IPO64_08200 [Bacteroidetes bacterium]|nr:hypothetical protein [Bacteroidota bacterium]
MTLGRPFHQEFGEMVSLIKSKIKENKLSALNEVYSDGINLMKSKCIPVYRDIWCLSKMIQLGISKICFDCDMEYTINNGVRKEIDNNNFKD